MGNVLTRPPGTQTEDRLFTVERYANPELFSVDEYVNRQLIEEQASLLIQNRALVEAVYKDSHIRHNDARTTLFEALTASGHLSRIEITGTLDEIHSTMLSVLLNGWNPNLPEQEVQRRFQEICEELTIQQIERAKESGQIPMQHDVATVSDYVSGMNNTQALSIGYRPYNHKGMVRSSELIQWSDHQYTRVTEQISRSNAEASETEEFLSKSGVDSRNSQYADVRVVGTQMIHEMSNGVVGLMSRLDQFKGSNIRYGEVSHEDQLDYDNLRAESLERERRAECYIQRLADFTEGIDEKLLNGELTNEQYQQALKYEIHLILQAICTMDPSYAKDCFGDGAVATYIRASDSVARGDIAEASGIIKDGQHLEQAISVCGMNITAEQAKQMGIKPDTLSSLLKVGKEQWKWTTGTCRVLNCPTRPNRVDVGPCVVCRDCQHHYDKGRNPAKIYRMLRKAGQVVIKKVKSVWDIFKKDEIMRR